MVVKEREKVVEVRTWCPRLVDSIKKGEWKRIGGTSTNNGKHFM